MYLSIWVALALFAAGELGRARMGARPSARSWPWWCWAAGIGLCAVHFALAFHVRHDWSQAAAVRATAVQTAAVYGLDWGGGFYANYLFLAVWAVDAVRWRSGASWPPAVRWTLRVFYVVVIANAAVIFAVGGRKVLGILMLIAIVASWYNAREDR